jgi:hypothetical protein
MPTVTFAKDWQAVFKRCDLETFQDFFEYSEGSLVNKNKKRDVLAFSLPLEHGNKEFFMKRFHKPHIKDMLFTLTNFGRLCSQAECEWNNANILFENGIDTYKPVCFGSDTTCGIERGSFFVTEKLPGQPLTDFVAHCWADLDQSQKQQIIISIAKLARKIHNAKLSLPDLYLWHIFIDKTNLAVIDLHRMKINISSRQQRIRNLAALNFSMLDEYFDKPLRELLLETYLSEYSQNDKEVFCRGLRDRSNKLAARRRRPKY